MTLEPARELFEKTKLLCAPWKNEHGRGALERHYEAVRRSLIAPMNALGE